MPLLSPKLFRSLQMGCFLLVAAWQAASGQSSLAELAQRASQLHPQPGDRVAVQVYGDPSLSGAAIVDELGHIMLPRIGLMQADAYSIAALRDTIKARMGSTLRESIIEVNVARRIVVSGEVVKPGVYFAELTSTFGEMVAQTGGLKETGHPGKVYLVRGNASTRIKDWMSDQSPVADLHSGDHIVVGRRSWFQLNIIPFAGLAMSGVSFLIYIRQQIKGS